MARCYLAMIKHIKNKYMTNDDDLEIATDGYKSKEKVCAFYTFYVSVHARGMKR